MTAPARERPLLLLIEDNRDTLVAAGRLLQTCGFDVEISRGGEDGIAKARRTRPDVIVTDVVMPDTSGCDVCRELHAADATAHIPLIVYTGLTDERTLAALTHDGVRVFAIKPCLPQAIAREAKLLLKLGGRDQPVRVVSGGGEALPELETRINSHLAPAPAHPSDAAAR